MQRKASLRAEASEPVQQSPVAVLPIRIPAATEPAAVTGVYTWIEVLPVLTCFAGRVTGALRVDTLRALLPPQPDARTRSTNATIPRVLLMESGSEASATGAR